MKKLNTSPLSGMQELSPAEQAVFNQLKSKIADVYHHHGYLSIETPHIDRTEVLLAKAGGDTEKQIYRVTKTAETASEADQALRFDHTVPLARYVVEHESELAFPFKVTQIGRNFRGERAQRGRFREFYQCDVDVIGRGDLPLAYDADAIATVYAALQTFDLPEMQIRVSNRKILYGFVASLGLTDQTAAISAIVDHAEKVEPAQTEQALRDLGLADAAVAKITAFTQIHGTWLEVAAALQALSVDHADFQAGLDELRQVFELLTAQGLGDAAIADMLIVRGLDYYTGTVFETFLPEYRQIGSIASGGRYDNLADSFTEQHFPGVGGSIGLTRLFYVLREHGLLASAITAPLDVTIVPISAAEFDYSLQLADQLRTEGQAVDVVLTDRKLGDKLTYASKIARAAIVIGDQEVKTGQHQLKEFK
jgi:histidyl-tRNA synthetase